MNDKESNYVWSWKGANKKKDNIVGEITMDAIPWNKGYEKGFIEGMEYQKKKELKKEV